MGKGENNNTVAYQGVPGAYSSVAAKKSFPHLTARGLPTFEDVVSAVKRGKAAYALLPIENSTSGRVADIHHLLPKSGMYVVGEYFLPIYHALIAHRGANMKTVKRVYSHREALSQCRPFTHQHGLEAVPYGDTAGAVKFVSEQYDLSIAAIAAPEASRIYGNTRILARKIQSDAHNVTRFIILQKAKPKNTPKKDAITSIVYGVRDIPAALYKSLGGFATTGTNIIKLESFVPMTRHTSAHFYLEFDGNPEVSPCDVALEELSHYAKDLEILGTYAKNQYRKNFEGK
jgi:prephenate dehydratase